MKKSFAILAIVAAGAVMPAAAAEPIAYGFAGSPDAIPLGQDQAFDWSGFYAGVLGGLAAEEPGASSLIGGFAGVNTTFDFYLAGAEVAVTAAPGSDAIAPGVELLARGGLLVTDELAVYALAGLGFEAGDNGASPLLGAGVELAVSEDVSIRGQYVQGFEFGSDEPVRQVTVGAAFHF